MSVVDLSEHLDKRARRMEAIQRRYERGDEVEKIAKAFGFQSRASIYQIAAREGWHRKRYNPRTSIRHDKNLLRRLQKGNETLQTIAEEYGVSRQRIDQIAKGAGIVRKRVVRMREDAERKRENVRLGREWRAERRRLRREDEKVMAKQLRAMLKKRISLRRAATLLGIDREDRVAYNRIILLAKQHGLVSFFGRWPQNRQLREKHGIEKMSIPWSRALEGK